MKLSEKKCVPCEGGVPPLSSVEAQKYLKEVNDNWKLTGNRIMRSFQFVNFKHTMDFVNKVDEIAEKEGHHPLMHADYNTCKIELWTHAINGLSENDFILAAKIDTI